MSEKDTLRGKSSSLCEANPQAARIPEVEASALVEELRDRVRSLERRPDEARESRRRADTNIAQLTQANTALAARVPEAPRDPQRGGYGPYTRGGDDELGGGSGPDTIHGGPGDDYITNGDIDYWFGEDENHGGRGNDSIVGNPMSEKHFGGRGDDYLGDYKSIKRPDTFRCGPGLDQVHYNKGLDKVAADCEKLWPPDQDM